MSPSEKTQPRPSTTTTAAGRPAPSGATAGMARDAPPVERAAPYASADPAGPEPASPDPGSAGAVRAPHREPERSADAAGSPRRVRLTVARFNPWSVAKLAFLLSVALGIVAVVAVALLWSVLNGMGVFSSLGGVIRSVVGTENSSFNLMDYIGLSRVLSVTITLGVLDVVLITVISTLASVLYNLASGLVGGLRLTLSDD